MLYNELLKDRPQAFRQLHKLYGFDFESDFICYEHNGNFTVNAIIKNASSQTGAQFNTADYKMVLLVKPFLEYGKQNANTWYLVDITGNNKPCNVGNIGGKSGIYDGLDYFFTLASFDNKRKDKRVKAVLIAQKVELLKPEKVKYFDYRERCIISNFKKLENKFNDYWIAEITVQCNNGTKKVIKTMNCNFKTIYDVIDKSGYIVNERRADLKRRAEAIRTEREKAYFLKADLSKYLYDAEKQIEDIKSIVSDYISKAQTSSDIAKINFYKLEKVFSLYERLTEGIQGKTFASINSVECVYNAICNYIDIIKNALNK